MSLKDTLKKAKQVEQQPVLDLIKPRNLLTLNPLMQKGGIHDKEDVDSVRKKARSETKQNLRQKDWLSE